MFRQQLRKATNIKSCNCAAMELGIISGVKRHKRACLSFVMPRPRSCAANINTVLKTIRRFKEQIENEDEQDGEYFSAESDQDEDGLSENSTREDMNDQQFVVILSPEEWCKSCSSVISGSLHQEPDENRHVLINLKYRGPFVECSTGSKCILKGTRRRSAIEELVEKNVSACTVRREEAQRIMHLGDNEPNHIPTLNALRLANSIREIGLDSFHVCYWTLAQLCVYQEYCKNHPFPTVASDATSGVTAKLKRPIGNVSGVVYLYSVAVNDHKAGVQYTVANMLPESHDNLRIHHFLESWLRSGAPVPKEAICDHSVALLSGLVKSFTQFAFLSEYLENLENEDETPTDFMKWAHQIISEVKGNLAEEEGDHDNLDFLPEIVVCIAKLMKFLPLWSAIMVPKFGNGSLVYSSAPVESIFNDIKHRTFQNVHLPATVDRFLETHLRSLDGEMKLVAATSPRKKVLMQRETDASQVIQNDISQNTTREDGSEVIGNNKLNNSKYKTGIISAHNPKCFTCSRSDFPTGAHTCSVYGTPVHAAFSECSIPYDRSEEGYGEKRLCVKCADKVRTAGLASLHYSYLEPSSEFEETGMLTPFSAVTVGLLKNSNRVSSLKAISLCGQKFILANTCSFDSLVQILATSYTDSVHYKDFVQNNNNIIIFKVVESLARNNITSGTYRQRAEVMQIQSLNNLEACINQFLAEEKMQCLENCDGLKTIVSTSSNQHLLIEVVNSTIVSSPSDIAYPFEVPLKNVPRKIKLNKFPPGHSSNNFIFRLWEIQEDLGYKSGVENNRKYDDKGMGKRSWGANHLL
ncbi:hypothetical protein PR048_032820 [Dryococelus australis]|uniref:Uncharacterized protein n=1 Tax=Dryococelus australis TaxID=614101 RepID=A0ABQ9G414_9NEOP|nr:hypothetical protein PR048_032820 [Dryococelus australis]